ncbi:uncharacterized protein [Dendropsophus ebraccatus]|uniref:uncharacterized protein n=1 Tax=Dendropsophus ebraccatus TaxID=150705 RepID=UPI003832016C
MPVPILCLTDYDCCRIPGTVLTLSLMIWLADKVTAPASAMASADLRDELLCSICLNIYTDPVTLRCGHNFCRDCIDQVLNMQDGSGVYSCPDCREEFQDRPVLMRNITLCNVVENFLSTQPHQEEITGICCTYCILSPVPAVRSCLLCEASLCDNHLRVHSKSPEHVLTDPSTSLENKKCSIHKEPLKYYCTKEAICICVSCSLAGEHQGHRVEMLDEASEKKKKKLKYVLQKLITRKEKTEERVRSVEEHWRKAQEKAAGEIVRVSDLFIDIRRRLDDLEKRVLSEISRQEEQLSLSLSDVIQKLEMEKDELSRKMKHIEELCNMTDPLTVLQDPDTGDLCDPEEGKVMRTQEDMMEAMRTQGYMMEVTRTRGYNGRDEDTVGHDDVDVDVITGMLYAVVSAMASVDQRDELLCSICLNIYTDPVTLRSGHNFCRGCIHQVLNTQDGSGVYSCPECREEIPERPTLQRNITLRNVAARFLSTQPHQEITGICCTYCIHSPVPAVRSCLLCEASLCDNHLRSHSKSPEHVLTNPRSSLENKKCSIHNELLKYYCTKEAICICVSCSLAGEHRGHRVEMLDKASEKKKRKLRHALQEVVLKKEETEERVQSVEERWRKAQEKASGEAESVTALFTDIRRRLDDLEKRVLSGISRQEEQLSLSLSALIQQLEIKKNELSRKMRHIEELCNMADPLTVLQDPDTGVWIMRLGGCPFMSCVTPSETYTPSPPPSPSPFMLHYMYVIVL